MLGVTFKKATKETKHDCVQFERTMAFGNSLSFHSSRERHFLVGKMQEILKMLNGALQWCNVWAGVTQQKLAPKTLLPVCWLHVGVQVIRSYESGEATAIAQARFSGVPERSLESGWGDATMHLVCFLEYFDYLLEVCGKIVIVVRTKQSS